MINLIDVKGEAAVNVISTIKILINRANFCDRQNELLFDNFDKEKVNQLAAFSNDDYVLAPFELRQKMADIALIELVKIKGLRFFVYRSTNATYKIDCLADEILFDSIHVDTYRDALTLIEYINRPSAKDLKAMQSHQNRIKFLESGKSDFDQAMKQN